MGVAEASEWRWKVKRIAVGIYDDGKIFVKVHKSSRPLMVMTVEQAREIAALISGAADRSEMGERPQ